MLMQVLCGEKRWKPDYDPEVLRSIIGLVTGRDKKGGLEKSSILPAHSFLEGGEGYLPAIMHYPGDWGCAMTARQNAVKNWY